MKVIVFNILFYQSVENKFYVTSKMTQVAINYTQWSLAYDFKYNKQSYIEVILKFIMHLS